MNFTHNNFKFNSEFIWRIFFALALFAAMMAMSDSAFAEQDENDVIGNTLCRVVENLTGGIARAISTIAIFAIGVGLFLGKIQWSTAASTAAGIGILFGAPQLVKWVSGDDSYENCDDALPADGGAAPAPG